MSKTIKITCDNKIRTIDVDFDDYHSLRTAIGGYAEPVATRKMRRYFERPLVMLVDEEGLIKGLPINRTGCWMYDTKLHGHPIVGDFLLAEQIRQDYAPPEGLEELIAMLVKDFELEVEA